MASTDTLADALFVGLDLDNTAFNTDKFFFDGVLPLLARAYPGKVMPDAFVAAMDPFRVQHGPAVGYDLFEQTTSLGLDADTVERLLHDELSRDDYLLPGVAEFVALQLQRQHDVQLISIGSERFQKLKIACVPSLSGLPQHIIMEPKGAYIATAFSNRRGYMIDDMPLEGLPPEILPLYVATGKKSDLLPANTYATVADILENGPAELKR